jgi:hypothetical protein
MVSTQIDNSLRNSIPEPRRAILIRQMSITELTRKFPRSIRYIEEEGYRNESFSMEDLMKLRLLVALTVVLLVGGMAFAGTIQLESSTRQLAPIICSWGGWDTGLTVINTGTGPLTITNFVFYSLAGEPTAITGKSYTISDGQRWSVNASEIIGEGLNGTLRFSIIGKDAFKALSYMAVYEINTFNMSPIATTELTRRE